MAESENPSLTRTLIEFFLDSLREDAGDVDNWCSQGEKAVDDIVADIERHLGMNL